MIRIRIEITDDDKREKHHVTFNVTRELVEDFMLNQKMTGLGFMRTILDFVGEKLNETFNKIIGK